MGKATTKEEFKLRYPFKEIQKCLDERMSLDEIRNKHKISLETIYKAKKLNILTSYGKECPYIITQQTRNKISAGRKEYLKEHPESHPWKNKKKFISVPCEKLKTWLLAKNILFAPEYQPFFDLGRFYSVDIAFPDKMIAVEINGNQHYDKEGKLKPYYAKRHAFFEEHGWKIYEIPYLFCFHENEMKDFFDKILISENKIEFDYLNYKPKTINLDKEEIKKLLLTETIKNILKKVNLSYSRFRRYLKDNGIETIRCVKIKQLEFKFGRKKLNKAKYKTKYKTVQEAIGHVTRGKYPSNEMLIIDVWNTPVSKLKFKYKVSDKAIAKYCHNRNIPIPPRGYWNKYKNGFIEDCRNIKDSMFKDWTGFSPVCHFIHKTKN